MSLTYKQIETQCKDAARELVPDLPTENTPYQHNTWINFGDCNPEHGQIWINNTTVDSTDDYAECVKIMSADQFGGPNNVYIIEKGSIYMPLDDADRVSSVLEIIGKTPSCATWIDKALAFDAYHGMDNDIYGGCEVVAIGQCIDNALDSIPFDIDTTLHSNASVSKYLHDNYLT